MPRNVICRKCNNFVNGWCEKVIDSPYPDIVRDCQHYWQKTNADCIRAMSDEELAEFLCGVYDDDNCGVYQDEHGKFINGTIIFDYDEYKIAEWLQQPAEE